MHNPLIQDYIEKFNEKVKDTNDRGVAFPVIIGVAICSFIRANTDEQLNDKTFYNDLHVANIMRVVSFINEHCVIDVKRTTDIIAALFDYRSKLAKGIPANYQFDTDSSFVDAVFGYSLVLTKEEIEVMKGLEAITHSLLQNALLMISKLKDSGKIKI